LTKTLPFRANNGKDPRIGFEMKKKGKSKGAKKFVERMKKIQEEVQAALKRAQEEMKKQVDRKKGEGDLVLLSMKDLKWQIVERRTEKLMERFVGPYKVKRIISTNAVELELPRTVKIYPIVNISRIRRYKEQVPGQKKQPALLVIIGEKEEYKVEKW